MLVRAGLYGIRGPAINALCTNSGILYKFCGVYESSDRLADFRPRPEFTIEKIGLKPAGNVERPLL